jgi:hypothetical protein
MYKFDLGQKVKLLGIASGIIKAIMPDRERIYGVKYQLKNKKYIFKYFSEKQIKRMKT